MTPEQGVKPLSVQPQSPCPSTVSLTGFHKVCQAFLICWLKPPQKGPGSWTVVFPLQLQNFKQCPFKWASWKRSWIFKGICFSHIFELWGRSIVQPSFQNIHLRIMAQFNAFIARVSSSYGSLDDVWSPSLFYVIPRPLTFERDVNVGWCCEGGDAAGSSARFRRGPDYLAFLCAEWLSGTYYLELPQIKDLFLLSQQDQSEQTILWLPAKTLQ